ncbi:MAG: RNA 2',3'-cyclic phosphodiesterase, partial [Bacteroidetes bacterium]|nr:RNA 2',3'-cyclic phosphodiesterase [Bacteroidota bacterium]
AAREHIAGIVECLAEHEKGVRWEDAAKIHMTVKFLGDVEEEALDALSAKLRTGIGELARAGEQGDIVAEIDRTGAFPNLRRPRIVWLGFDTPPPRLHSLRDMVEAICVREGMEADDKRFTPHLTIGRVRRNAKGNGLENGLEQCSFPVVSVRFTALSIMTSNLTSRGAIHSERTRLSLTPGE